MNFNFDISHAIAAELDVIREHWDTVKNRELARDGLTGRRRWVGSFVAPNRMTLRVGKKRKTAVETAFSYPISIMLEWDDVLELPDGFDSFVHLRLSNTAVSLAAHAAGEAVGPILRHGGTLIRDGIPLYPHRLEMIATKDQMEALQEAMFQNAHPQPLYVAQTEVEESFVDEEKQAYHEEKRRKKAEERELAEIEKRARARIAAAKRGPKKTRKGLVSEIKIKRPLKSVSMPSLRAARFRVKCGKGYDQ